jgi:acetyltransferase-like isoleucine patch superfamily enzyme
MRQIIKYLAFKGIAPTFLYRKLCRPSSGEWAEYLKKRGRLHSIGENVAINSDVVITDPEYVRIGNNVLLERKVRFSLGDGARVYIGDGTYLGDFTNVLAVQEVNIGKDCAISWHVLFMDTSSHPLGFEGEQATTKIAPIRVQDHVWIGCRAVILKGVTVGEGAIIANNAVVTKDVPPRTMVAGNPARVIKKDVIWE